MHTCWSRALEGRPTVVLGALPSVPPEVTVVRADLRMGLDGLAGVVDVLGAPDLQAELARPLGEHLLLEGSLPAPRSLASIVGRTVLVLEHGERAGADVQSVIERWLHGPAPLVLVSERTSPLTALVEAGAGVVVGAAGPALSPMDPDTMELLLFGLSRGGRIRIDHAAEAWCCSTLRAAARLEAAARAGFVYGDGEGYVLDTVWAEQRARQLSPTGLAWLRRPAPAPTPLSAAGLLALGAGDRALSAATTDGERGRVLWALGRAQEALPLLTGNEAVRAAWDAAQEVPPSSATADDRALFAARAGRMDEARQVVEGPWARACLPFLSGAGDPEAMVAIERLLETASPSLRPRLDEAYGRIALRTGLRGEAARSFGRALPDLHAAGEGRALARVVVGLARSLERPGPDLLGWLQAAIQSNLGDAVGMAWCAEAVDLLMRRMEAGESGAGALQRLDMQVRSLRGHLPTVELPPL